ncbi:MAG: CdiI family contact-dependent growth inhibition immunity protein [Alphaproteobacteria bacterium]|nr:CdiI family contact-dependent growth inhibition immunity protein [Alphaproteobacteria bacterium]
MTFKRDLNQKNAGVYVNEKFYSIETLSGMGLLSRDFRAKEYILLPDASEEELGQAILGALSYSRVVNRKADPELWDTEAAKIRAQKWIEGLMQRFGYKTRAVMFRKMKSCDIVMKNGMIEISPSRRERNGNLFTGEGIQKSDYIYLPDTSTPAEIGAGLKLALSRCLPKEIE